MSAIQKPFTIYPAVDIMNGECVRLTQGQFDKSTVYNHDPAFVAKRWQTLGAKFIHVVDLDGARSGEPQNLPIIREILRKVNLPVQVGGGIRNTETIEKVLDAGASRVIIGSAIIKDPKFAEEALKHFGDKVIVSLDCRDGKIATEGWAKGSDISAVDIALELKAKGLKTVVYTDIARDGMLEGPNLIETKAFAEQTQIRTIVSGGIHSIEDIKTLMQCHKDGVTLDGVIVGKALYDNKIKPQELFAL